MNFIKIRWLDIKWMILVLIMLLISTSGCYELIATNNKTTIITGIEALMTRVDEFQDVFSEAAAADLINVEETQKRNESIDKIQKFVVIANEAIKESPTLIEAAIKTNQASSPVNPYAGLIDVVLKIIAGTGTAGVIGLGVKTLKDNKTKKEFVKENDLVKRKYTAEKRGLERLRIENPGSFEKSYEYVGDIRKALGVG